MKINSTHPATPTLQPVMGEGSIYDLFSQVVSFYQNRDCKGFKSTENSGDVKGTGSLEKKPRKVCFYNDKLGPGGAQTQFCRVVHWMKKFEEANKDSLTDSFVCTYHSPAAGDTDQYLDYLTDVNVEMYFFDQMTTPRVEDVVDEPEVRELMLAAQKSDSKPPHIDRHLWDQDFIECLLGNYGHGLANFVLKLAALLKKTETDVLYLWKDAGFMIGAIAGLIAGVPRIVGSFRGMVWNLRKECDFLQGRAPQLLRDLDKIPGIQISFNNNAAAHAYSKWLDIEPSRFAVIPNIITDITQQISIEDVRSVEKAKWKSIVEQSPKCTTTVLGTFRVCETKRPKLWIRVAAKYAQKHPTVRFVIVGDGQTMEECRGLVTQLGMQNHIFLAGFAYDVYFWLENASMLMHLSRDEGLANSIIEAQMAELPVLATPAGGTEELVLHKETGYLLDQRFPSESEVIEGLDYLIGNPEDAERIAKNARKKAIRVHHPESIIPSTVDLLLSGL